MGRFLLTAVRYPFLCFSDCPGDCSDCPDLPQKIDSQNTILKFRALLVRLMAGYPGPEASAKAVCQRKNFDMGLKNRANRLFSRKESIYL